MPSHTVDAEQRRALCAEKGRLLTRLRGLATTLNSYYPRPAGQSVPLGEQRAREEAREVEQRLREIAEVLDA